MKKVYIILIVTGFVLAFVGAASAARPQIFGRTISGLAGMSLGVFGLQSLETRRPRR
jgi:hypothetical protein